MESQGMTKKAQRAGMGSPTELKVHWGNLGAVSVESLRRATTGRRVVMDTQRELTDIRKKVGMGCLGKEMKAARDILTGKKAHLDKLWMVVKVCWGKFAKDMRAGKESWGQVTRVQMAAKDNRKDPMDRWGIQEVASMAILRRGVTLQKAAKDILTGTVAKMEIPSMAYLG